MEVKTTEEYVINKLFETENTLKSSQEELLKAKETIKKLKEGIDIIAERASIHQVYNPFAPEDIFRIDFNSILNDSPAYNIMLNILRTSKKFYTDEWFEITKKWGKGNEYD